MRLIAILLTLGLSALSGWGCASSSAPPVVLNLGPAPVPGAPPKPRHPAIDRSLPKLITVRMQTTAGDIVIELDHERAPITVENFLRYADRGEYNGTIFHRVVPNFVVQGGGHTLALLELKGDAPIKNEWQNGLKNVRGSVAMARLGGDPDSASCQFFINVENNAFLDKPQPDGAAYAAFATVTSGMDVVDKIRKVATTNRGGHGDVPKEPVVILQAKRI